MHEQPGLGVPENGIAGRERDAREDVDGGIVADGGQEPLENQRLDAFERRDLASVNFHVRSPRLGPLQLGDEIVVPGHAGKEYVLRRLVAEGEPIDYSAEELQHLAVHVHEVGVHKGDASPEELRVEDDLLGLQIVHHDL